MLFSSLILFLYQVHLAIGSKFGYTRVGKGQCDFNYISEDLKTTKGNKYANVKDKSILCCSSKVMDEVLNIDNSKRQLNCCTHGATIVGGVRPCPGSMVFTSFGNSGHHSLMKRQFDEGFTPVEKNKCPTSQGTNGKANPVKSENYRLIAIVQKGQCLDKKKPFHMKFMAVAQANKKYAYSWCCSKDIYSDYTLDPKVLCCGLSGAQSNYFAEGSLVMPDNPPCCRLKADKANSPPNVPCEPHLMKGSTKNKSPPYRTCPPISGLYNVTPYLDELVPKFGPYSYALPKKVSTSADLYTKSECPATFAKSQFALFKHFYSYLNFEDRLKQTYGPIDTIGLCCYFENMFAYEVKIIQHFCCTVVTKDIKMGFEVERRIAPCKNFGTDPPKDEQFYFEACNNRTACINFILQRNQPIEHKVRKVDPKGLYGSDLFFATKNSKVDSVNDVPV